MLFQVHSGASVVMQMFLDLLLHQLQLALQLQVCSQSSLYSFALPLLQSRQAVEQCTIGIKLASMH